VAYNDFIIGETVPFSVEVRNAKTGELTDPDVIKITVTNIQTNEKVVDGENMTKDSVGIYHYDYDSASAGKFLATYEVTDNSKVTIARDNINISN
jgi:hypothetical protein